MIEITILKKRTTASRRRKEKERKYRRENDNRSGGAKALYCGTGAVKTLVKGTEVVSRNII